MQNEGLVQVTLFKTFGVVVDASGVGTIDHDVPFHCSARFWEAMPLSTSPTAMQLVGVGQDTPSRKLRSFVDVLALGTTVQVWPSHVSTSVWSVFRLIV